VILNGRFLNHRENLLDHRYLRQKEKTKRVFDILCHRQKSDILVIPAQFSPIMEKSAIDGKMVIRFNDDWAIKGLEFRLGLFHVSTMLITHPERLIAPYHINFWRPGINCTGDDYDEFLTGKFSSPLTSSLCFKPSLPSEGWCELVSLPGYRIENGNECKINMASHCASGFLID